MRASSASTVTLAEWLSTLVPTMYRRVMALPLLSTGLSGGCGATPSIGENRRHRLDCPLPRERRGRRDRLWGFVRDLPWQAGGVFQSGDVPRRAPPAPRRRPSRLRATGKLHESLISDSGATVGPAMARPIRRRWWRRIWAIRRSQTPNGFRRNTLKFLHV